jgi:hypothetical protein
VSLKSWFRLNLFEFFRYISYVTLIKCLSIPIVHRNDRERYPLISQVVDGDKIPEFGAYDFPYPMVLANFLPQTTSTLISMESYITVSVLICALDVKL